MALIPLPVNNAMPDDSATTPYLAVRSLPAVVKRIDFTRVLTNSVDSTWGSLIGSIGSGMGVNQTGGNLVLTSGTTARSETIIRSTDSWKNGIRMRCRSTLSQRIANNSFFVELVDTFGDTLAYSISSATVMTVTFSAGHGFTADNVGQSMFLGNFVGSGTFLSGRYVIASVAANVITFTVAGFAAGTGTCSAFGWNYYHVLYDGTTATQTKFDTQRKGYATGDSTPTINTTATPGHVAIVTANDLVATFSDQVVATSAAIAVLQRASRIENVPDDFALKVQIRMVNGSTAPATTTTWTIGALSMSNYENQDVVIQDVRPMTAAQALPIEILRSVALSVNATQTGTWTVQIGNTANTTPIIATPFPRTTSSGMLQSKINNAASTNATSVKASAGQVYSYEFSNSGAAWKYVRLYNLAVAPTVGTSVPVRVIAVPPGGVRQGIFDMGLPFATGIAYAITGAATDLDSTALATANECIGSIDYI